MFPLSKNVVIFVNCLEIYSRNAWLVNEEVGVLGTNNSRNLQEILSPKFT